MKTATLAKHAAFPKGGSLPAAQSAGESNPGRHKELSRLASDVIKDALSLIHLPNYPESYVEDRLRRRAAMVLALLSTSEHVADEDFQDYAEEMLTMTIFSEIMELQA